MFHPLEKESAEQQNSCFFLGCQTQQALRSYRLHPLTSASRYTQVLQVP